jgi:hypothetical protein
MLTDRIKVMYGKEIADRYIELLNNHGIKYAKRGMCNT